MYNIKSGPGQYGITVQCMFDGTTPNLNEVLLSLEMSYTYGV
jgi:hypothetical protein